MSKKNCSLCNSAATYEFISEHALHCHVPVYKCKECGVVFLPTDARKVDDRYWNNAKQKKIYLDGDIQEEFDSEFNKRIETIMQFKQSGKLLDVGCGLGHFLVDAKKRGFNVYGLDASKPAIEHVRTALGIEAEVATIETSRYPDEYFDVITLWDVWEHIQDPAGALLAIRRKLKKGGLLVLKTPNENSLFKRLSRFVYRVSFGKLSFLVKYVYYIPHYFSYTKATLTAFLGVNGFTTVKVGLENSLFGFTKEKIKTHYRRTLSKDFVTSLLPFAYFLATVLRMQNKMVVYAVKESE